STRISEQTGRLWDPDELLDAFRPSASSSASTASASPPDDEATLPDDLLKDIREGGVGKKDDKTRSALFQSVVDQLKRRHWTIESIVKMFEKYPNGVGAKYQKRLRKEVERSYGKATGGAGAAGATISGPAPTPGATAAASGITPQPAAAPQQGLPTPPVWEGPMSRAVRGNARAPNASPPPSLSPPPP